MRKHRNKKEHEVAYGIHAVESMLKHSPQTVLQIWLQKNRDDKRINNIVNLANKLGISIEQVSTEKLNKKYEGVRHQGVVARIRADNKNSLQIEDILHLEQCLLLVLDGVEDPHNIGACLRTADAAGVDAVVVSKNRSPGITPVVRKVASGAADTISFIEVSNLARCLQQLKDNDVWIVGTADETNTSVFDCKATRKMALVMGAEDKGLRRLTRESCDELVKIPMAGSVESLNVSVATGICLYELQRKQSAEIR